MFQFNLTEQINELITQGAKNRLTDNEFIENEIQKFLASEKRKDMITGEKYYRGEHDILRRKRTMIGEGGKLVAVENVPTNRIVNNQYKKSVLQKVNYLLSQPLSLQADDKAYAETLNNIFDKRFLRLLKNVGKDSLNCGIGWIFIGYDEDGVFTFKRIKPYEIIPGWRDAEHTILDYAIRIYEVIGYEGKTEKKLQKVEIYDKGGIYRFVFGGNRLIPDDRPYEPYLIASDTTGECAFNWTKIPLIPFKYNADEIPLISGIKSLQDGLNLIISSFLDNMEEDARNTILVLVNYDGENLADFRKNLSVYGVVKIKTEDGIPGDVRTLQVEVNASNYQVIIEIFKKAIIENIMGFDAKDDRLAGNPNQMNIESMYSEIDLDANEMETEYQAAFEQLIYFINLHLSNTGIGDFGGKSVDLIFNRDMLLSESEIITSIQNSVGILSEETLIAQHPWVSDAQKELERVKAEREAAASEQYGDAFHPFKPTDTENRENREHTSSLQSTK